MNLNLMQYDGKRVKIVDDEGQTFIGRVNDYIYPEDNEPVERESIIVDTDNGEILEFYEEIIKTIDIIE